MPWRPTPRGARPRAQTRMARPAKASYPVNMSVVFKWNGTDVPDELRRAPEGRYLLVRVDDDAPELSDEEDAGLEAALVSVRDGRGMSLDEARRRVTARLAR